MTLPDVFLSVETLQNYRHRHRYRHQNKIINSRSLKFPLD
jgi:hypothetical protein